MNPFKDRRDAGRQLALRLMGYRNSSNPTDVVVLGLPRGGVPVAFEVARALNAHLDVFVVRKIGVPVQPELAMGAIASGGVIVKNYEVMRYMHIDERTFERVAETERGELQRREKAYRDGEHPISLSGKTCIIVDDGIATGASMQAAVAAVRAQRPRAIVVATPVAAPNVPLNFSSVADAVVCVHLPGDFSSVGLWYEDFSQTTDEEVKELLKESRSPAQPWLPSDGENSAAGL